MLSILIPTYNYNAYSLVAELHRQCLECDIDFEIICQDDASPSNEIIEVNEKINQISHCKFERNKTNLGRSKNRNILISKACYPWVLLMDCDMFPKEIHFINTYLNCIKNQNSSAFFGGIMYHDAKPNPNEMLRWIYGKKREEVQLKQRLKNPYRYSLTSNFLIKKELLSRFSFDENLFLYGYEDTILINQLRDNHIFISQIENPAYHLQLDTSFVFLEKTEHSLGNLKLLIKKNSFSKNDSDLAKTHHFLYKLGLQNIIASLFGFFEKKMKENLLSGSPSLNIFLLYKIGYFCKLNSK